MGGFKLKILAIAHNSDLSGGANRSLLMVIEHLIKDYSVKIRVLVPSRSGALVEKLNEAGILWDVIPYYGVISGLHGDRKDIIRKTKVWVGYFLESVEAKILTKKYKNEEFDLVYSNTRLPYIGAALARNIGIKHICHVREFGAVVPYWPCWDYQKIYDYSDKIILISYALMNEFEKYVPPDKLITIHNGIDNSLDLPQTQCRNHEGFHLLLAGRLVADKGHIDAISAIEILRDKGYEDIWLHLAGSAFNAIFNSSYVDKIKKKIVDGRLENVVIFHGEVSDMVALRRSCDCELICSIRETFGRVTIEGMRSGLLVIGANTGGTVEIISDGETGLLYEQGNAESLANKIAFAYDHREETKQIVAQGYSYAQKNFTPDDNVKKIFDTMNEVIQKNVVRMN